MFLILKNSDKIFLALEGSDSVVSSMYASLKEEYKDIELDIAFDRPSCKIERNLVRFINLLNGGENVEVSATSINSNIIKNTVKTIEREESKITKANNIDIDVKGAVEEESIEIEEPKPVVRERMKIEIEEPKPVVRESMKIEIEEPKLAMKESMEIEIEEVKPQVKEEIQIEEVEPVVVKRVDPAERALEKIREQQRQEGLPKLENKVNTLEYRKYLENFMKLGFAASVLSKKADDLSDRELKAKMNDICNNVMKRVEHYEERFRAAGLTTAQIHTFRMEALREVKKYRDSSYEEVFKYLRKLYDLSEELIKELD